MKLAFAMVASMALVTGAHATEGGGSIYPVGSENFVCCALPPPGLYGIVYAQHYRASKVRGDDGKTVTPDGFKVRATAIAPRLIWVSPYKVADGSFGLHAIAPIVDLRVDTGAGPSQHKTGLGDIVFGPFIGWHHSAQLHSVLGLDVFAPTGRYDKSDVANIGRNYWALQPVAGVSWIDPSGLNADAKVMWTYNFKNDDTRYRSGQELIVDYSLGWGVGGGFTIGIGGYLYRQVTDDVLRGAHVDNSRGRALAIGPSLKYDSGKGWFVTGKLEAETHVRNRADGAAFWLKAVFPL